MAKQKIKKIEIIVASEDVKSAVDYIQHSGVVELTNVACDDNLTDFDTGQAVAIYSRNADVVKNALDVINRYSPTKSSLLSMLSDNRTELTADEYADRSSKVSETLALSNDIVDADKSITAVNNEIVRLQALREGLEPWLNLDVPMKLSGSKETTAFIGTVNWVYSDAEIKAKLSVLLGDEEKYEIECISSVKDKTFVFALCHNSCKENFLNALRSIGFAYPQDPTKHSPSVRYERYGNDIEKCKQDITKAEDFIRKNAEKRSDLEFSYDYFNVCKDKYSVLDNLCVTKSVFVIDGFIAESDIDSFKEKLENKFTLAVDIKEPDENDDVPVKLKNNSFAAGVEGITTMYSAPGKDDVDPNPIMSFFYYLLFGIMLSDAGYGLLMALATGIAKLKFKPTGNMKKTVDLYFYCGIATVFWGALFGSWFGDLPNVIATKFLGRPELNIALWFEPVKDPMKLLLFSFLFGIIHLFAGVAISFYNMWRHNNKIGAVCDCIPVFMLIIGICPLAVNLIGYCSVPEWMTVTGKYLLIAGAGLIVATAGRSSKNIIGKLGLGLYGLYNAASGWLGDILSYSRLLALGLCTGVIATVINTLGTIPENSKVRLILFIPVFIFGHTVNMAINLIGTYVHTNRLQYVEFFGKFYEGGGRNFTPFTTNTKFIKFKED